MNRRLKGGHLADTVRAALEKARNYLENNAERTEYALARGARLPSGSGVTEAACKHIIRERVCGSAMKWRRTTLQSVLSLHESSNRWEQFWTRIERFGY
ncbi:MAG: ISKra4 family transposase [Verrucomicrobiales bacterium]|nr:ISKra4 family transposase [Verrucomicrobiales bacterium]